MLTEILLVLAQGITPGEYIRMEKPMLCSDTRTVISELVDNFGETPSWIGQAEDSYMVIFKNKDTGSWSVVQMNDSFACVLEVGKGEMMGFEET